MRRRWRNAARFMVDSIYSAARSPLGGGVSGHICFFFFGAQKKDSFNVYELHFEMALGCKATTFIIIKLPSTEVTRLSSLAS